ENEIGSYGLARYHSPEAERLFRGPVPAELVRKLGKKPGTWSEVFGDFAKRWPPMEHDRRLARGRAPHRPRRSRHLQSRRAGGRRAPRRLRPARQSAAGAGDRQFDRSRALLLGGARPWRD